MDIVLATHNRGKVSELRSILAAQLGPASGKINLTTADELGVPDPVETGVTFEENALLKARFVAQHTGLLSIADDSGLIVDIFGAAPGILSARWAGMHGDDAANNALLLAQLSDIEDPHRGAAFECCAAMVVPAGACGNDEQIEICRHGEMRGRILREPYGSNGFGYDPIFAPDDAQAFADAAGAATVVPGAGTVVVGRPVTSADLTAEQKNAISHRGKAMRALAEELAQFMK